MLAMHTVQSIHARVQCLDGVAITLHVILRVVEGVTKHETNYPHAKYALKFEVSSVIFLQISSFLADEVLRKAAGNYFFSGVLLSCSFSQHSLLQFLSQFSSQ